MIKFYTEYFVYNKRNYWFILPAVVFFYDRYRIYDELKMGPSFGFTFRWLTLMAGFQIQFEQKDYKKTGD